MSTEFQVLLDALISKVADVEGAEQSAIVALQGITAIVQGLRDDLSRLGVTPEQLAAIDDLTARLAASSAALAAAVVAGALQGTAFKFVQGGQEPTVGAYDIYLCNPANVDPDALHQRHPSCLVYSDGDARILGNFADPYFVGQLAVCTETDFWHLALPISPANRMRVSAWDGGPLNYYPTRPSASLGVRLGNYWIDHLRSAFDGVFADDCTKALPQWVFDQHFSVAADYGGEGHAFWSTQYYEMIRALLQTLKARVHATKSIIANTAGDVWAPTDDGVVLDGMTVEAYWIAQLGDAETKKRLLAARQVWLESPDRFPWTCVQNIAWYADWNIRGLVYRGFAT